MNLSPVSTVAAAASTAATTTVVTTAAASATSSALARSSVTVSDDVASGPLALLVIVLFFEGDSLALVQALESILLDGRKVDEDILTSIIGGDEPESLVREELYFTGQRHLDLFYNLLKYYELLNN
jgi:hypothetical protein